jgi:uncharacterized protein (DUF983 family)
MKCSYCPHGRTAVSLVNARPACKQCRDEKVARPGDVRIAPLSSARERLGLAL